MSDVIYPHGYSQYHPYDLCKICGYNKTYVLHNLELRTRYTAKTVIAPPTPVVTTPEQFLPRGTRYWEKTKYGLAFLIEIPPGVVDMTYKNDSDYADESGTFKGKVAHPWTYLWIHVRLNANNLYGLGPRIETVHAYWAKERIEDMNSKVYIAQMPNVEQEVGSVCMGGTMPNREKTVNSAVEAVANSFYLSKFNPHYAGQFPYGDDDRSDTITANFKEWKEESKKNPYCWMDWDFGLEVPIKNYLN